MRKRCMVDSMIRIGTGIALCACISMPSVAFAANGQVPAEKNETVYVHTNADGSVKSTEVETALKNPSGYARLSDSTNLSNIEGTNDKAHAGSGDSLIWEANGGDVTYKGTSSLPAPVAMSISYTLDGNAISADELAGKSGHVVIRYDFENLSETQATVNGDSQTIYTPFTCVTVLMFDGDDFKNIAVENGKTISDGDDVVVAGYAMPGLQDSLGPMVSDAGVPGYFKVEADATNFELKSTMTIVTAGLMSDFDAEKLGIGNVDDVGALNDAMSQLISGSVQLSDGLETLTGHLRELESGTSGIQGGAQTLSGGLAALAGENGLASLSGSANMLASSAGLIGDAVAGMKAELLAVSESLNGAVSQAGQFESAMATMQANREAIVKEGGMSEADFDSVVQALGSAQVMAGTVQAIAAGVNESAAKVDELNAKVEAFKQGATEIAGGAYAASQTAYALTEGAQSLESYASQLNQAVPQLTEGVQAATDGSKQLTQGMRTFNDQGISRLVHTIRYDYGGLLDRVNALSDAAKSYTNFGGITEGTTGSVKFVFETDAIKKQ